MPAKASQWSTRQKKSAMKIAGPAGINTASRPAIHLAPGKVGLEHLGLRQLLLGHLEHIAVKNDQIGLLARGQAADLLLQARV